MVSSCGHNNADLCYASHEWIVSFRKRNSLQIYLWSSSQHTVCVCVCVCVNRPRVMFWQGLFKHRLHQQSPSWWYAIVKRVWFTKTRHPDTNSPPYKNKRDARSSLPWHETSLLLHSTSCSIEQLRKGRTKMRHLKTCPRNIRSSQSFHIGWSCVLELELSIL